MSVVPDDLIREILSCLPVKSLIRFRCVSSYFCALIDSPGFAKEHLNRSINRATNNYLTGLRYKTDYLYSANLQGLDQPSLLLHRPFSFTPYLTKIIGSANGLLCVYDPRKETIVIWNPATRKYHRVANPQSYAHLPSYGFCYDYVSDDYKLLRIDQFSDNDSYLKTKAQLYSLRSNSWHIIDQEFPASCLWPCKSFGKSAGTALHWMANPLKPNFGHDYIHEIVAFDLITNKYRLVAKPVDIEANMFMFSKELGELDNFLSLTCHYDHSRVDMWLMKNHGGKESWSKMFSICQLECYYRVLTPLTYSKRGDEILLVIDEYLFFWYNPDTGARRHICGYEHGFDQALICRESMISPNEPIEVDGDEEL